MPDTATREAYARAYAVVDDVEATVGIELRPGDDIDEMTHAARDRAVYALNVHGAAHDLVERNIEWWVQSRWPGRAYFIETETEGCGVQVYQPYGMPQRRVA